MKFHFLWVGKTKNEHLLALQEEYLNRLSRFVRFEITELKESKDKFEESKQILRVLNQKKFVVLLTEKGKQLSSLELAQEIEKWQSLGIKEVTFVVGGAEGVTSEVAERVNFSLSLSVLTFTHEMARVILIEQLYRAYTIMRGYPYQK
ncbi:MAG: 23S rRNA (pseudouridine(1915)-N(3))-methyltransferase RlmH [Pyrinomonadaceae bacterium]|nr:23S rRNA (pseudouridine(1915)-N(3))-methyltransferase RlmH [Pyrinomonadaceae bacterium]MCX7639427.1 23S rRNA (pseudouridine(1915)-N(3))-methyltransferase RlmH [Pyrinomonadaceae bacterium]MDW8304523.1 23S rRNA (pseudouridine(1915)-N(3))-methyltransferase RlmH [Acidobacteriota bacterium]